MIFFKRVHFLGFISLGMLIFISGCKKDEPAPESTVVEVPIGVTVSLSGAFAPYGPNQKNGLTMAINEINTGWYIPGIKLVPYFVDDQSSPDTCRKIYRDLIFNKKVLVIIGPTSSNCAFAADTIAQNNKTCVIGISNTVPGITEMGNYIFRNSLPESTVIPNTVRETHARLGYSRVAIVYGDDDPYTLGAYNAFKSALENEAGVSIVSTEIVHKGDVQFTDQLSRVQATNPDVIVLAALVNEASKLMIQARVLGIPRNVRFIGGNSFNTSKLWELAGAAAQGSICGTAWIKSEKTPGNVAFIYQYTSLYKAIPDQFAAQAYTSVYILANALKSLSPVSREALRNSMANITNLETILGKFSFDQNRNPLHPPVVQELTDGQFILF